MSTRVISWLIPILIILNLLLFLRLLGLLPQMFGQEPDPSRISRQINPAQVKIVPAARP